MKTWLVVAAASFLVALAGAPTGTSNVSVVGSSIFTAEVTSQKEANGQVVTLKRIRDRHGNVVGWGDTSCLRLGNGSSQCVGTFVLPEGKVLVAGTRHDQNYWSFAVIGGQGVYNNAGGVLVANTYDLNPRRERLVFLFS